MESAEIMIIVASAFAAVACVALIVLEIVHYRMSRRRLRGIEEAGRRRLGELERELGEMRQKYDLMYDKWFERAKAEDCERNHYEAYD